MIRASLPELEQLLQRRSGLDLGRGGMGANLERFVSERLDATGMTPSQYIEALRATESEELRRLLEAMTVVYTWFFRDPGQFSVIEQVLRSMDVERTSSIWVAGCATGEEPYSVALIAARLGRKVDILGTDLNSEALRRARDGRYPASSLGAVDPTFRAQFLGAGKGDYVVPDSAKKMVRFELSNLVETAPRAPTPAGWDMVICRNVLIYFSREQARRTLDALATSLTPGGYLVLGASEGILEKPSALETVGVSGRAVLRRPQSPSKRPSQAQHTEIGASRVPGCNATPLLPAPRTTTQAHAFTDGAAPRPNDLALSSAIATSRARPAPSNDSTEIPYTIDEGVLLTASMALDNGHAALDAGDILAARRSYIRAIVLEPNCAEALMFMGITHFLDGDLAEALHQLRAALYLDATLWAACFYQALCYENMGYAKDAARSYAHALRLAAKHGERGDRPSMLSAWRRDLLSIAQSRARPDGSKASPTRVRTARS